jgi:hypothetical protein
MHRPLSLPSSITETLSIAAATITVHTAPVRSTWIGAKAFFPPIHGAAGRKGSTRRNPSSFIP